MMRRAWRVCVGALLCQGLLLSLLVVGWTQRLMQRETLRAWHARGSAGRGRFGDFARASSETAGAAQPPTWFASPVGWGRRRARLGGLAANLRLGLASACNTWVLTLPGCALWLFAWYDGWNNSFSKGYEQAGVGPGVGLLGVALFAIAMLYVPMAQARQAAAGHFRAFYDFRAVWSLAQQRWASSLALAALYALLSVPVMVLKTAPIALDRLPGYADWSDAQVSDLLGVYFLLAGVLVFVFHASLRRLAARVYAHAVLDSLRAGSLAPDALSPFERNALERLGLLPVEPLCARPPLLRALRGAGVRTARGVGLALTLAAWLAFVAQVFVSEFLNYHPVVGWLNQPLVQLPFFRYLPPGLG